MVPQFWLGFTKQAPKRPFDPVSALRALNGITKFVRTNGHHSSIGGGLAQKVSGDAKHGTEATHGSVDGREQA